MNQAEACAVFSELCGQIEKEAKKRQCKKLQLDKTLPPYEGTCLWRTVSDSISGAENCTVTRRSPAHWPVMSEGNRHVFNHLLYQILA